MVACLCLAMMGFALGLARTLNGEWQAIPNFFFSSMFFVFFWNVATGGNNDTPTA